MKRVYIFFFLLLSFALNVKAELSQFPAPTNLNTTNIIYDQATLSWDNNTNGIFWIVSYNISQSSTVVEQVVTTNSLQISNLILGIAYNWKVRMIDNAGDTTQWSDIQTFLT